MQGGAQADSQLAHLAHLRRGDTRQPVAANDVDDHQLGAGPRRDARCPAHQGFRFWPTRDGDDNTFARLPGVGDLVLFAVLLEGRVDLVGQPQQRQFAQRREVSTPEVVRQRGIDTLGRVDVAVGKPAPQRFRRDVDQFDLVGSANDLVGYLLLLLDSGDLGDDVVEALQVLHVDRRDDRDARVEQFLDVLPAFGVLAAGRVGVREFVDKHDLRLTPQHSFDVELRELFSAVRDVLGRHHFDARDQIGGFLATMRLYYRGDHIGAALHPAVRFAEHREGLADARRRTQVDAQLASLLLVVGPVGGHTIIIHRSRQLFAGYFWSSSRLSCSTLTLGSPRNPSQRPSVWSATACLITSALMPRALATLFTCRSA